MASAIGVVDAHRLTTKSPVAAAGGGALLAADEVGLPLTAEFDGCDMWVPRLCP